MSNAVDLSRYPARSPYFSLTPIGVGTAGVESLESYACRLAQAHSVPRHRIEQRVNDFGERLYDDKSGPPRLDSPTKPALEFGARLATLTMQPQVAALGLGRFSESMSSMHTLRRQRAWCSRCFSDARNSGVPAHLPLVWSFPEYQSCHVHDRVLESRCRRCSRGAEASNSWHRQIDHCPTCDRDLAATALEARPTLGDLARRDKKEIDRHIANVLGEFVAEASVAHELAPRADVERVVASSITRQVSQSFSKLSESAGLAKSTLHCIMTGRNWPSLSALTRLASAADVGVAGIFYPSLWREDVRGAAPKELRKLSRFKNNRRKHDWDEIRREAQAALDRGEPVSLQGLARELQVDQAYLGIGIGDLRQAILTRGRESRLAARQATFSALFCAVREARMTLMQKGERVSARAIGEALNRPPASPYLRQALKAARREAHPAGAQVDVQGAVLEELRAPTMESLIP